jgi:hypothetical protein
MWWNNLNPLKKKALVGHTNLCEWTPKFEMHNFHSSLEINLYATSPIGNICMLMKQIAILATQLFFFVCSNGTKFQNSNFPIFCAT